MRFHRLAFIALSALVAATGQAQELVAHINFDALVRSMPAYARVERALAAHEAEFEQRLDRMQRELEAKFQAMEQGEDELPPSQLAVVLGAIQELELRIQVTASSADTSYALMEQELLSPLLAQAQEAIAAVADRAGVAYVIDSNQSTVLYTGGGRDLMPEVKARLSLD